MKVRKGGGKEIPLVQGKEQWLRFAGTAVKRYAVALGKRVKAFYEGQLAEAKIIRLTGAEPLYHHQVMKEQR